MIKIVGNQVTLREVTEVDVGTLYYWKYQEEEQAAKKWNGPYILEMMKTKEQYRKELLNDNKILPNVPNSLIIEVQGGLIGYVSAYWIDKNTNWLETGIVIYDKDFWNGGFGFESYKLWMDFLFEATKLHRLGMSTWSGNIRMMKVATKVGMREEARIRNARIVGGELFDAIKMGMLREEWEHLKAQ